MDVREKLVELPIEDALLILREEHRQRTDSYTTYLAHGGKGDPAEEVGLDALAMAISALEKTKWVSVNDRLPEPFVSVLVHMPGEEPCPTVREGFISNDGIWQSAMFRREPGEVTHWQPMPQPPKGE